MLKGTEKANKIYEKVGDELLTTTSISIHEILVGAHQKEEFMIKNLLQRIETIPFDVQNADESSKIEKKLIKKGNLINSADILIAGICISNDATLVTFDKDFNRIPGLKTLGI